MSFLPAFSLSTDFDGSNLRREYPPMPLRGDEPDFAVRAARFRAWRENLVREVAWLDTVLGRVQPQSVVDALAIAAGRELDDLCLLFGVERKLGQTDASLRTFVLTALGGVPL